MNFKTPILLLVFNRIETTKKVFAKIKEQKPSFLYIAADGSRDGIKGEKFQCKEIRNWLLKNIDWECDLKTNFQDQNLGCGKHVSQAITWFFDHVEMGIILEDDCLPDSTFFTYCETMLLRYKHDPSVMLVSGDNFQKGIVRGDGSYYFSKYAHVWGWASWKRVWDKYDFHIRDWSNFAKKRLIKFCNDDISEYNYWLNIYTKLSQGEIDTWDYQLMFLIWNNNGKCINPNMNLVSNIGFDNNATHTTDSNSDLSKMTIFEYTLDDIPSQKKIDIEADKFTFKNLFFRTSEIQNSKKLNIRDKFYSFRNEILPVYFKKIFLSIFKPSSLYVLLKEVPRVDPPRFVGEEITFLNKPFRHVDLPSFEFIKKELFDYKIYNFKTTKKQPYIIDCGANIGLSILFFKSLYRDAKIIAFEPDKKVVETLRWNLHSFGYDDVEVIEKALWDSETTLEFMSEGSDGGRLTKQFDQENIIQVKTVRLRSYLEQTVDFLKIDIEGAETRILADCEDLLCNVDKIFVEYHSFEHEAQELDQLLAVLKRAGFRYNVQHIGVFSRQPFMQINAALGMDNQLNIFAYK